MSLPSDRSYLRIVMRLVARLGARWRGFDRRTQQHPLEVVDYYRRIGAI